MSLARTFGRVQPHGTTVRLAGPLAANPSMGVAHAGQFEDVAVVVSRALLRARESDDLVVIWGDGLLPDSCSNRGPGLFSNP